MIDVDRVINYIFSGEHIATLLTIIVAIVIYEILKKGVRKGVGYIAARRTKFGVILLIIAIFLLLVLMV